MSQEPGQLIARKYRLERLLARGGMGEVWVARHVELEVEVALKFSRVGEDFDDQSELRFKREAQAAAKLRSPHIVQIHDYGVHEGAPYIAMELLEGEDLGALLARVGRLPVTRARDWLGQTAKALAVVHKAGVVHRDIKPSNLFLAEGHGDALLKMLDFGIAKIPHDGGQTTSAGLLLGSPAYMSPEQARGNPVDARSDLWSLAAVFYRMLTGSAPFEGSSSGDILVRLCTEEVEAPSRRAPELGPEIDTFFRRALARAPEERFGSIAEFMEAALALPCHAEEHADSAAPRRQSAAPAGRTSATASLRRAPSAPSMSPTEAPASEAPPPDPVEATRASAGTRAAQAVSVRALVAAAGSLLLLGGALLWSTRADSLPEPSAAAAPEALDSPSPDPWRAEPDDPAQPTTPPSRGARPSDPDEPRTPEQAANAAPAGSAAPPPRVAPARAPQRAATQPARDARTAPTPQEPHAPEPARADPVFGLPLGEEP